jgi:hemoglobin-like flavoprotein
MTSSSNPIERSFELAAAACDDLTPLVYRRLFRDHPEAQAMFRTEGSGRFRLIESEVFSHDAYGTPRELFVAFFAVIADCLRDILGEQWSGDIDAAWHKLLRDIAAIVQQQQHPVDARA